MKLRDSLRADAKNNILPLLITPLITGGVFLGFYSDFESLSSFEFLLFISSGIIALISLGYLVLVLRHRLLSDE